MDFSFSFKVYFEVVFLDFAQDFLFFIFVAFVLCLLWAFSGFFLGGFFKSFFGFF